MRGSTKNTGSIRTLPRMQKLLLYIVGEAFYLTYLTLLACENPSEMEFKCLLFVAGCRLAASDVEHTHVLRKHDGEPQSVVDVRLINYKSATCYKTRAVEPHHTAAIDNEGERRLRYLTSRSIRAHLFFAQCACARRRCTAPKRWPFD